MLKRLKVLCIVEFMVQSDADVYVSPLRWSPASKLIRHSSMYIFCLQDLWMACWGGLKDEAGLTCADGAHDNEWRIGNVKPMGEAASEDTSQAVNGQQVDDEAVASPGHDHVQICHGAGSCPC